MLLTASRRRLSSFLIGWTSVVSISSFVPRVLSFQIPVHSPICQSFSSLKMTPTISLQPGDALFGKFVIPSSSIFYRSECSVAFVNLRPIVPGHVLVIPSRSDGNNALLSDLTETEYIDLWLTTRKVQSMLQKQYNCTAFNVAVQDGRAAGQSVPHAHVHILPRSVQDAYAGDDAIYEVLEAWAPRVIGDGTPPVRMEIPEERKDRTPEMMAEEASTYRKIMLQQEEQAATSSAEEPC